MTALSEELERRAHKAQVRGRDERADALSEAARLAEANESERPWFWLTTLVVVLYIGVLGSAGHIPDAAWMWLCFSAASAGFTAAVKVWIADAIGRPLRPPPET